MGAQVLLYDQTLPSKALKVGARIFNSSKRMDEIVRDLSSNIQEMELLAVVTAIHSVPRTQPLTIYTDHKTICDVLARPVRANCERGRNRNIWNQLRQLCATRPVKLEWVRGHDGNPGNEAADRLARFAARQFIATMSAC